MSNYSICDFEEILFNGFQYKLPQSVLDIITQIDVDLQNNMHLIDEYKNTNSNGNSNGNNGNNGNSSQYQQSANYKYNSSGGEKKRHVKKEPYHKGKPGVGQGGHHSSNNYQKKEVTNNDWENLRNYKPTKITKVDQLEGVEKSISKIKSLINKISDKTYDTCNQIIELIDAFMEEDYEENNEESRKKMCQSIFDIMISNKFNSEMNAELYSLFIDKYCYFTEIMKKYVDEFKNTIESIVNVDPDKDYDAYCVNVKKNDVRKSSTMFLMNLFKHGKIEADKIMDIIEYFLDKTIEYIEMENKTYMVEEITENVFLMVNAQIELLCEYERWKTDISTKIIDISRMKANQHPSLTNRVVFKYMDIIDSM